MEHLHTEKEHDAHNHHQPVVEHHHEHEAEPLPVEPMEHVSEPPVHDHGHQLEHDPHAGGEHASHVDHTGHEDLFRRRFWVSLLLSIPVLLYTPMLQEWFGFHMPIFRGSTWIAPIFAATVFAYGGVPFLQMAVPELRSRKPGMMMLISLGISVSLIYSLAAFFFRLSEGFFWELVTLIDIMLLGHWIEMRSVRQASGALDALAKLMPDTAEHIMPDGSTHTMPASSLKAGDLVLVRPGTSVPADGVVEDGTSDVNESMITGESKPVKKTVGSKVIAGTINGEGSYKFQIAAVDGTPDTFRIKIWTEDANGQHVIYDNGSQQAISGGSIVVHK